MIMKLKTVKFSNSMSGIFRKLILIILMNVSFIGVSVAQIVSSNLSGIVIEQPVSENDFPVVSSESASAISYDNADYPGVIRAIRDLQNDIENVTGKRPAFITNDEASDYEIIIGTLGKNKQIDNLVSSKKLDVKDLKGKWGKLCNYNHC